jgi:ATP-dependent helicase HrpA
MPRPRADDLQRRLANLPRPTYPDELPVVARRAEIARAIRTNPVVIVCGETGSGKTTQLPKICLDIGRGVNGLIGHTQPRRIAARTVANRIAQELHSPLGQAVGYKIRFSDHVSADTYVKLMTDGILLAETQGDRLLGAYDTLIIDEAHERSLNIDFLLGYLKQILPRRPDLKIIVTSATIDAERFANHFAHAGKAAPVIEVSGRMYPVELRYRPLKSKDEDEEVEAMEDAIVDAVDDLARAGPGDVLVFLPGEREIRETAELLRKHHPKGAEILPLYARLSFEEQDRVFKPHGARRIVLATNVAETSLTVPGIRYVIDTGLARVNRYSYRNKVEQLQVEKISRASASQRAGRCGRVAAGICVRLYAEDDYAARAEFTDPEVLRTSLAAVILRMKSLKIGEVERFPFLEAPSSRMIADGYQLLAELGAVDDQNALTDVGWQLAKFPLDPRIARMILAAKQQNCLAEILIVASALSVQDPRERPFERAEAADKAHERFADDRSDFMAYLKLWEFFGAAIKHKKSNRKLIDELHASFLSHRRLREWREIHGQLHALVGELKLNINGTPATYEQIHRALLAGLLGNIGFKAEEGDEYLGARGIRFAIFPGSVLRKAKPKWVVAAEITETARLYGRCVAKIEPEWLESMAGHLVNKHYFDPHWEKERAMVTAFERVTLYGLTIVAKRRVHYGPLNPREARGIFIRQGLAEGNFETRAPFFAHNQRLVREVQELEHKARRRDVLVDDETIFRFYDDIVPPDIYNGAGFDKWRGDAERANARLLFMTREYLMRQNAAGVTAEQFPEQLTVDGIQLKLRYRFEPAHPLDGVTATVPLALLNQFEPARFEWLVPGLIREKVAAYFKALPKAIRKQLMPLQDQVTRFLEENDREIEGEGVRVKGEGEKASGNSLTAALAHYVKMRSGDTISPEIWDDAVIPAHLRMNFRVIDDAGRELATGRDLNALKAQLGQAAQLTFAKAEPGIERAGLTAWDCGDVPGQISFERAGRKLTGYPALVDEGESVAIRLFDTRDAADASMRSGVIRLLRIELKEQMKQLDKTLPGLTQAAIQLRGIADADDLKADLVSAICDRAFIGDDELPRSETAYAAQKERARTRLPAVRDAACRMFTAVAEEHHRASLRLGSAPSALNRVAADVRAQLQRLVYKGYFSATPWEQLQHLPRYLKAMSIRLDKFPGNPERDQKHAESIAELWKLYQERSDKLRKAGGIDPALENFRWQIEELRVSLFAQELKTPYPVSIKRLQKIWAQIPR